MTTLAVFLQDVGASPGIVDDRSQLVNTDLDPSLWPRRSKEKIVYLADQPSCQPAAALAVQDEVSAALPFGPCGLVVRA